MDLYLRLIPASEVTSGRVFVPADADTIDRASRRKTGEVFKGAFKLARNYKFLQKAHCLINFAFDCQDIYEDKQEFREAVTIEAGYFHWKRGLDGHDFKVAKSWAFDNMSEVEFEELYLAMIQAMKRHAETVFNGADPDSFEQMLLSFGGSDW